MTTQAQAPPRTCAGPPLPPARHAGDPGPPEDPPDPAPPPAAAVTLPGTAASVPAARQFIRRALAGCPRAEDLAQAVTELAANAVTWSAASHGGTFTLRLRTAPRWARIEVTDPGPAPPPPAPLPPAASNGWGLGIVTAVTDRSGTATGPGRSRTAWAEVTWPPARRPAQHLSPH
jgi:anti-sigma regulatory factor (Ser/Thr protein kinase)